MTEQYQPRNINAQGSASRFVATVATPNVTLQPGDQSVVVETTLAGTVVTLPPISDCGPNCTITIVKEVAANTITVAASGTDAILIAASAAYPIYPMAVINATLTYKSVLYAAGAGRWVAVAGTGA